MQVLKVFSTTCIININSYSTKKLIEQPLSSLWFYNAYFLRRLLEIYDNKSTFFYFSDLYTDTFQDESMDII